MVNTTLVSLLFTFLTGLSCDSCPSNQVANSSSEIESASDNNYCFEQIARAVWTDDNFFEWMTPFFSRIAQAVRTDANFFRTDSPSCANGCKFFFMDSPRRLNGCKFFLHGEPELFEQMPNSFKRLMHGMHMTIRSKTANHKEHFRMTFSYDIFVTFIFLTKTREWVCS